MMRWIHRRATRVLTVLSIGFILGLCRAEPACCDDLDHSIRVGTFRVDISPPVGSPLAYDPCIEITDPLECHGIVLVGRGKPIVLCAVDWLGVANASHDIWRDRLATAVGTTRDRVALHAVHQHDAPRCDLSAAALLAEGGYSDAHYDVPFLRQCMQRTADAATKALSQATEIDEIGLGEAEVSEVASNRRLIGEDGMVYATRYTATADPEIRAAPVGTIDPVLRSVSFWSNGSPVAVMTYYACHPQSYYRTGQANPDFPGYARNQRAEETGVPHVHFNGAGGNIGAGKWNDGAKENRKVLTDKVAQGMKRAFENTLRKKVTAADIGWESIPVELPAGDHLDEPRLIAELKSADTSPSDRLYAAKHLAWVRRCRVGDKIDVQCLRLDNARILHMPGELFVEYQLGAAAIRPDLFVAMAAYGQYGCGYIGTREAYGQGGYETSGRASRVDGRSEQILMDAVKKLLAD
jgi:hypothetical protein